MLQSCKAIFSERCSNILYGCHLKSIGLDPGTDVDGSDSTSRRWVWFCADCVGFSRAASLRSRLRGVNRSHFTPWRGWESSRCGRGRCDQAVRVELPPPQADSGAIRSWSGAGTAEPAKFGQNEGVPAHYDRLTVPGDLSRRESSPRLSGETASCKTTGQTKGNRQKEASKQGAAGWREGVEGRGGHAGIAWFVPVYLGKCCLDRCLIGAALTNWEGGELLRGCCF